MRERRAQDTRAWEGGVRDIQAQKGGARDMHAGGGGDTHGALFGAGGPGGKGPGGKGGTPDGHVHLPARNRASGLDAYLIAHPPSIGVPHRCDDGVYLDRFLMLCQH